MFIRYLLFTVFTILCGLLAWWLYFTRTNFYKLCMKIPGPAPLPVIGNIHQIFQNKHLFIENILKLVPKYNPFCRFFLGRDCYVLVQDPDDTHTVLHSKKTLSKSVDYSNISKFFGDNSLLTAKSEPWRRYRRIMNRAFKNPVVKNSIAVFNDESRELVKRLKRESSENIFDINSSMSLFTLDTVLKTNLGVDDAVAESVRKDFLSRLERGKDIIQYLFGCPWYRIKCIYDHSSIRKKVQKLLQGGHSFLDPFINAKKIYYAQQDKHDNGMSPPEENLGFLDCAFQLTLEDTVLMTETEIFEQTLSLAGAAIDTTAYTLSVCLMMLGLRKDVQDKVFEELREVFGEDTNRSVEHEDIRRLVYLEQVINETLRLFPVAFVAGRMAEEDIELGGYLIPAGANILLSPYLLHRNEKYFPDPLKFDPERFSLKNSSKIHPRAFIPFMTGPRMCIGHYYARLEMKVALAHVLRNFEFLPCGSRDEMEDIELNMLIFLRNGYNVRMKVRH